MFFVPDILVRKGPLSIVWLAAHYDKKLTKFQVMSSNIDDLINIITSSNIKISLRITCDLMIGLSKLIKIKSKFLYNESNRRTTAIHIMAGQINGRTKSKSRTKVIDLPDDRFSVDLNLPEIYEFIDMNLPDPSTVFPKSFTDLDRSVSRGMITMQEIPPLTEDELRMEQEIHDRLYGDVDSVDFNEFFDDVLPLPRPQPQSPPISVAQSLSPELMPPPSTPPIEATSTSMVDVQRMDDDDDHPIMTEINTPPLPFFQTSPTEAEKQSSKKRTTSEQDFTSTIEKRRRTDTNITVYDNLLGSLELPVLDESSRRIQPPPPRRRPIRNGHHSRLIIDYNIRISDNVIRKNMLESYNWSNTLPNIFVPKKKLFDTCADLFDRPKRLLAKGFQVYFQNARHNSQPEPEIQTTATTTTTMERIDADTIEMSPHLGEDFFQETLPSPFLQPSTPPQPFDELTAQSPIHDNLPPIDYDHDEIPMARGEHIIDGQDGTIPQPSIPEFSITDRTTIDEKFNETLDDLFAISADHLQFEQLNFYDNRKRTVLLYFFNLLVMKNNEQIDLEQESSIERFNPIYIHRVNRSEAI